MSTVKVNELSTYSGTDISIETGKTVSGTASQFKMTDVVQGDVLYGSAADTLSRLAPGTSGQYLQTAGAGANPIWASGKILQVVSDTSPGGDTTTTSGTFDTIKSGLATIITPASATNKILLLGTCSIGTSSSDMAGALSLYKNASDFTETYDLISGVDPIITDGEGWGVSYRVGGSYNADGTFIAGLTYLDTANTTNAITYSISTRVAGGSGTITLASPRTTVTLIAMEIAV